MTSIGPADTSVHSALDLRRLALGCTLLLLLPLGGPIYQFSGSASDEATLSRIYGPPDGGPLAFGPALYALPAGWILASACLLLAISAFPSAPRRLRSISVPKLCILTGIIMLGVQALTPVESLMRTYLGVSGSFNVEVGRYLYFLYACLVMLAGLVALMIFRRGAR